MTIDQFLARLSGIVRDGSQFKLIGGCITSDDELCPIHQVHLETIGVCEDDCDETYFTHGRQLGLSRRQTNAIARAADYPTPSRLRAKLLAACDLSEE